MVKFFFTKSDCMTLRFALWKIGTEEIYVTYIQNPFTIINIQNEPSRDTETKVLATADGTQSFFVEGHDREGLPTANETNCHSSHD